MSTNNLTGPAWREQRRFALKNLKGEKLIKLNFTSEIAQFNLEPRRHRNNL